jgi:hypothetical protein
LPINPIRGKSIDDILVNNNRLILVDNIIFPKYLFEYDISIPNKPIHKQTTKLPNNGTYEHIYKGDINDNWMILLSHTMGDMGAFSHITIYSRTDKKYALFSFGKRWYDLPDTLVGEHEIFKEVNEKRVYDICLSSDFLYILKGGALYCLNLTRIKAHDFYPYLGDSFEERVYASNENTLFTAVQTVMQSPNRLLKISENACLLLNESEYELVSEVKP